MPKLYREEDIRPHRNFALCKPSFRLFLSSSLLLEEAAKYLFDYRIDKTPEEHGGDGFGKALPPLHFFQPISVQYPDEEEEEEEEVGTDASDNDEHV